MKIFLKISVILTIIWLFSTTCQNETNRKVKNIETFARLYGYARWFHPSDEAQEIDWDKFAVLGIQKVENIKSPKALRDTLYCLFSPIVQGLQIYKSNKPEIFNLDTLLSPDLSRKQVAWQHNGVFLGETPSIYRSERTNKFENKSESGVTKVLTNISHLSGKEVKLSGYFKKRDTDNRGSAQVAIYPITSMNEIENDKHEAIIESQEWKKYELVLTIPEETNGIIYSLEVGGDCEVWADDFEFLVNNGGKWEPADTLNMGFEHGEISVSGSQTGDYWRAYMQHHLFEISDVTPHSGKYCLKIGYTGKLFDRMPQSDEVIREQIGNNITCVIPLFLLTNNGATYPKTEISVLTRLKSEIDNIDYDGEFNSQVNLASVVIAWNVLQHFFPYFDVIDTDWESVLGKTLKSTLANKRKSDFYIALSEMVAKLDDGHGIVYGEQIHSLPIRTELVENQIVITESNHLQLKRGDIVKKIDGKPVMKVLYETEKMVSGSPQLRRHRALNILGSKFDLAETNLVIIRDGMEKNVTIPNSRDGNIFFNPIDDRQYLSGTIVEIEPGIYYINMTNCTENDFDQKIDVLANAKAVIYDQRGGSRLTFFHIVPYLIEEPVVSAWWNIPQIIYPDRRGLEFSKSNWDIQPKQPLFKSQTIIINVPSIVSSGETMMGIIDHYNLATTVGGPTAGCNGNVNQINLPCGYRVWWTGMKVLKHDGSQLYLKGFQPDYPVNRTIQAVSEGRDEYLETALKIAMHEMN